MAEEDESSEAAQIPANEIIKQIAPGSGYQLELYYVRKYLKGPERGKAAEEWFSSQSAQLTRGEKKYFGICDSLRQTATVIGVLQLIGLNREYLLYV